MNHRPTAECQTDADCTAGDNGRCVDFRGDIHCNYGECFEDSTCDRGCFATWASHANERLAREGRLVQVGLRISGRTREHWAGGLDTIAEEIIQRYARLGVTAVYVSNDIDGTDTAYVAATGTPEHGGLTPELVRGRSGCARVVHATPFCRRPARRGRAGVAEISATSE